MKNLLDIPVRGEMLLDTDHLWTALDWYSWKRGTGDWYECSRSQSDTSRIVRQTYQRGCKAPQND